MKKIEVMEGKRYAGLRDKLWYAKGNKARARAARIKKTILNVYVGLEAFGGRGVVPFPFGK